MANLHLTSAIIVGMVCNVHLILQKRYAKQLRLGLNPNYLSRRLQMSVLRDNSR
jgi:hypothetical protein